LANLYLGGLGAELLAEDASGLVGLSEETTCHLSAASFDAPARFEDFVVHEAAHTFHNCKRETFAYACEAYSRLQALGHGPREKQRLLAEHGQGSMPPDERVDTVEYVDILPRTTLKALVGDYVHVDAVADASTTPNALLNEVRKFHGGNDSAPFDPASSCERLLACVRFVRIVDDATGTYARTHAGATDTGADADTCAARDTSCLVDTDTDAGRTMACRYAGIHAAAADPETDTDTWYDRDGDAESDGTATGQNRRQADDRAQTRDGKDIHRGFFLQTISVWPLA
jgi:hypothetical protein